MSYYLIILIESYPTLIKFWSVVILYNELFNGGDLDDKPSILKIFSVVD